MPDTKISDLAELTSLAATDEFVVVDKSDTAMAASGTNKRVKKSTLDAEASLVALAPSTSARNVVQPTGAAIVPFTIKGAAAQTADLFRIEESDGDSLLHLTSAGVLTFPGYGTMREGETGLIEMRPGVDLRASDNEITAPEVRLFGSHGAWMLGNDVANDTGPSGANADLAIARIWLDADGNRADPSGVTDCLYLVADDGVAGHDFYMGVGWIPPPGDHKLSLSPSDSKTTQGGMRIRMPSTHTGNALTVTSSADGRIFQALTSGGGILIGGKHDITPQGKVGFLGDQTVSSGTVNCAIWRNGDRRITTDALITLPPSLDADASILGLRVGSGGVGDLYMQQGWGVQGAAALWQNAYYLENVRKWAGTHASFGARGIVMDANNGINFYADNAATTANATASTIRRFYVKNDGNVFVDPDGNDGNLGIGTLNVSSRITLAASTTAQGGINFGADNPATNLYRLGTNNLATDAQLALLRAASSNSALWTKVTGDATARWELKADGKQVWGDGTAAGDVNLYRSAANVLKTDDKLHVVGDLEVNGVLSMDELLLIAPDAATVPLIVRGAAAQTADLEQWQDSAAAMLLRITAAGQLQFGSAGDTNLYRSAANILKTDDTLVVGGNVSSNDGTAEKVALGTPGGFAGIYFGSALDTTLYRSAADTLRTDDKLLVTGELELDGALNHDGTTVGFYTKAPVAQNTGWGDPLATETLLKTPLTTSSTLDDTRRYVKTLAKALLDTGLIGA